MTPSTVPVPEHLGTKFRVRDARAAGLTPARLTARDLDRPFWGVRTTGDFRDAVDDPPGRGAQALQRALAYAPRMSPRSFYVLHSAALILGLPIPIPEDLPVHVGVHAPHRAPRGAGVRGHQVPPALVDVQEVNRLRVTTPASTWAQLAAALSVRDLVAVGDAIVRIPRRAGGMTGDPSSALGTIEHLRAAVSAGRRVGIGRLREALPLIRQGCSSRPETHLRLDLAAAGLPVPALDFEVRDGRGRLLGISEIAFPAFRVAVEYEGDQHRVDKRQWNRDIEKYRDYQAAGWSVVRITADNLYGAGANPSDLVRNALRAAHRHELG